jgi:hypothetical protein
VGSGGCGQIDRFGAVRDVDDQRRVDPVSDPAGQRSGALKHLDRGLLSPRREVRDAVSAGVQPDRLTAAKRDRFMP